VFQQASEVLSDLAIVRLKLTMAALMAVAEMCDDHISKSRHCQLHCEV